MTICKSQKDEDMGLNLRLEIADDIADWLKIHNRPFRPSTCCQIILSNIDNSQAALKNIHKLVYRI